MKKKKSVIPENYLTRVPAHHQELQWETDEKGNVTLQIENKGWVNRMAQKFFKRPRISYVHLDELGSFLWPLIDGEKNIIQLGELVELAYGEEAHPLYERLARYFQILDGYHFIRWARIPQPQLNLGKEK